MRFKKLDLNLLVALDTLLTEQSITKGAEKLNMSPSALSNSLSRLREYFNDDLLAQVGRKMLITPFGENLKVHVRNALNNIESTILIQPTFEPQNTDRIFSIFCSDYTQTVFIPYLLEVVGQHKCTARFEFLAQIDNPHEQLERGEADLLIIPSDFVSKEHPNDVLYEEEFACVVWQHSELAKGELTKQKYAEAGHVVMRPGGMKKGFFELSFANQHNIERRIAATTFSFASLPALVIGTDNIATIHARLAHKMAQAWPLKIHPLPFDIPVLKQCAQWHQYRHKDEGLIWLRNAFQEAAQNMGS
ncbi:MULTISPECIES: LysR family transcriptional regulator [Marinomonas]|jgi:transcriptional regulator, LysR family|uniref:Transcriptional regulator, LysR family n=3 Tax=Marinomonas TaxID=28253 RepID=F2K4R2_MARM1|nr:MULTISPECIES: LysR family transcriptional regulator [Marinomonas]ADZ91455.1 transcriptional regulator, LysR family [Marinomonas mediterranea MMB-1]AEF55418.1 transcriptional regulator, LysR family [Marinomonas posidonica IVIA-Po-181]RBO84059.1 LysR family transcriptional regulator [Marinomonas aquiplantarum]WCN09422.1 LysR family transcriptional regulator [Marinomonas mediterranea]WCN17564.1 LysR family transcriptional regulator [Marinomonas mediterranea MMB-1]